VTTIAVFKFDTPEGAGQMLDLVQDLADKAVSSAENTGKNVNKQN